MKIAPQPGPQTEFLSTDADIAIYGGAAGGGKTWGLLAEPLRHIHNPRFGGVIFRRTSVDIRKEGALWDTSAEFYPMFRGRGASQSLTWRFPSGAAISMAGMEHDDDRFSWHGSQITYLAYDELTHFSEQVFWYMLSRNRSTSGIRPYIRGACNPDPDSWVKPFIQWWLDPKTGYAIPRRSGVKRWFVRLGDKLHWDFTKADLRKRFGPEVMPKSVTFIPASVYDNKILLSADPGYLANLMALNNVEREQLLNGNWNIRASAGTFFPRHKATLVDHAPPISEWEVACRYWDRAASELRVGTDPDATVGVLIIKAKDGYFYVVDVQKMYAGPFDVNKAMIAMAKQDGHEVQVAYLQDPGSAGVYEAQDTARMLTALGFVVHYATATGDKKVRAKPFSSIWNAGLVRVVKAPWNGEYFRVLENFPDGKHDDEVDGSSGAAERITTGLIPYVV